MAQRKKVTGKPATTKATIVKRDETIAKKKAVFVDGPSLSNMRPILGIDRLRHDVLFKILTGEIGEKREMVQPTIFTISDRFKFAEGMSKNVRMAGFEPKVMNTQGGADDQFIINQIRALDPKEVAEIVIVTADRDYVACLREKASQGIKVFWLAVHGLNRYGRPMIAPDLEEIFERGEFTFMDLAQYKGHLMRTPWVDRPRPEIEPTMPPPPGPTPPSPFTVIKVTMEMTVNAERAPEILHAVGSLMGNVLKLKGIVGNKTTTEF